MGCEGDINKNKNVRWGESTSCDGFRGTFRAQCFSGLQHPENSSLEHIDSEGISEGIFSTHTRIPSR